MVVVAEGPDARRVQGSGPDAGTAETAGASRAGKFGLPTATALVIGSAVGTGVAPKIEACRRFVAATGQSAAIGSLAYSVAMLGGAAGTTINAA